jgi:hypothetical protein
VSGTARSHTRLRASGQGALLDRRGKDARSYRSLLRQLAEAERQSRAEIKAAEQAEPEVERDPRPSPAPPQPTERPPWPTQAEIDTFVDRLMAGGDVADELWVRFAAHEPTKTARERALGTVVALVADAWRDRLAAR